MKLDGTAEELTGKEESMAAVELGSGEPEPAAIDSTVPAEDGGPDDVAAVAGWDAWST